MPTAKSLLAAFAVIGNNVYRVVPNEVPIPECVDFPALPCLDSRPL
ncbi:MAG: hypothetical protein JO042_17815 [Sinobacteraceae bacterium]|nr:hypothetical protein [Nevskiaceae bacterium]